MTKVTARHLDTCQPCYLTDHHNRSGETLLYTFPCGQSPQDAAEELFDSLDVLSVPDKVRNEQIINALTEACQDIDLTNVPGDEPPYVYVLLSWGE